ncbi:MAG: hypothetical protein IT320_04035 [Anaerolineae bacterium]|nr:hypothetical protein [Anaerolineae bacterium]
MQLEREIINNIETHYESFPGLMAMPMHISWLDDEHTIILCSGEGHWTWEDFAEGVQRAVALMNTVSHRVDLIYDRKLGSYPPRGSGLPHYKDALQRMPENAGMHVFVGAMHTVIQVTMRLFFRLYGRFIDDEMAGRFVVADSVESAKALIDKDRAGSRASVVS